MRASCETSRHTRGSEWFLRRARLYRRERLTATKPAPVSERRRRSAGRSGAPRRAPRSAGSRGGKLRARSEKQALVCGVSLFATVEPAVEGKPLHFLRDVRDLSRQLARIDAPFRGRAAHPQPVPYRRARALEKSSPSSSESHPLKIHVSTKAMQASPSHGARHAIRRRARPDGSPKRMRASRARWPRRP